MRRKVYELAAVIMTAGLLTVTSVAAKDENTKPQALTRPEIHKVLADALAGPEGEYAALATYQAILEKFGQVQPCAAIAQAEERHIAALERQLKKYNGAIPANEWTGKIAAPASLKEAAGQAIKAEEANVSLYDGLLAKVGNYADLTRVFGNLQRASRDHHLVAFKTALAQGGQIENFSSCVSDQTTGTGMGCCAAGGGCGLGPTGNDNSTNAAPGRHFGRQHRYGRNGRW